MTTITMLLQIQPPLFNSAWIALATFSLAFITSVAAIAVMWGTFRADMRATREWIKEHEAEAMGRDTLLLEHTKVLARIDAQITERDRFYSILIERTRNIA